MTLSIGTRLGPYELADRIGQRPTPQRAEHERTYNSPDRTDTASFRTDERQDRTDTRRGSHHPE